MAKGKELIRGLSGNKGQVVCKLRVIDEDPEMGVPVSAKLKATVKGECLVAIKTVPEQEKYLELAAALIQNTGGKASHGNVFARTKNIPSVYNTQGVTQADGSTVQLATEVLKDGQMVVVEGYTETIEEESGGQMKRRELGAVYEYIPDKGPLTPPAAGKPSLADLMAKYGMKQR